MDTKRKFPQISSFLCCIAIFGIFVIHSRAGAVSTVRAQAADNSEEQGQKSSSSAICDPQIYSGVQHCTDGSGVQYLLIDPRDPHVRFQTVISSRGGVECNSVNHSGPGKDPGSNCYPPYPLETLSSMLSRYISQGAVAIINTDYFGTDGDHGAQGLAVRNGIRLDGSVHQVFNDLAYNQPSLAISEDNTLSIGTPVSQEEIESNLAGKYYNTVAGAPLIVSEEQVVNPNCTFPYPGDTCAREAQSAAGITANGQLILVTARMNAPNLAGYLIDNLGVQTALKFDGGGSARLAWLDSNGNIQSWGATGEDRAVAEGLLVFSSKVDNILPPDGNEKPFNFLNKLKRSWAELLTGFTLKVDAWWQELQLKLKDQLDAWWQEQQVKIKQWTEQQLTDWFNQCLGSVSLVPITLGIVLITRNKKKNW